MINHQVLGIEIVNSDWRAMRTSAHSQGSNMQTNLFSFDRNANKIKIMFLRIQMNVWKEVQHYLKFQN